MTLGVLMQPFAAERKTIFCWKNNPPLADRRSGCSVKELDRPSLRALLTLTDLHSHTLTFRQPAQSAAVKRRRMDENILPTAILAYKAKSLIGVVPFD